ncbi:MAG: acylneuraminate cytidylyltransferase family protein [Actinomycetota bacterium]|nr:acylneuraminate cytidylyltransferase family protein [Actinomycetota bacterium]
MVGLIPARGGSKGIPRKNLVELAGKPLAAWTIGAACAASTLSRVVVSTDSEEIAALARELGANVLDRPDELAADETPMLEVVRHAVEALGDCDVLVLLQPTSPLRRATHVDEAVSLLLDSDADAVVSVVEVPHQFRPSSLMELRDGRLERLADATHTRRQDKPVVYARNGPAILALRPDRLGDDLYAGDLRPYVMAQRDSVDVDGPDDLELAEALLRGRE